MPRILLAIVTGFLALTTHAYAQCSSYPYVLTNGTTANATEVMANFNCAALSSGTSLYSATLSGSALAGNTSIPGSGQISSGGSLGLGMAPTNVLDITKNQNGDTIAKLLNASTGSAARSFFYVHNGTSGGTFQHTGTGYSPSSMYKADATLLLGNGTGGLTLGTTGPAPVSIAYNNSVMMQVNGTGVGIGTASPSYLLTVNGTAYASGAAGALSDLRHKRDVISYEEGALSKVMQLRPVKFLWKQPTDDGMKGAQLGFLAQEVERVLPSVVLTADNPERTKGLKYNEIVAILAKAIQEQQEEIAQLNAAQSSQSAEIRILKAQQAGDMAALKVHLMDIRKGLNLSAQK